MREHSEDDDSEEECTDDDDDDDDNDDDNKSQYQHFCDRSLLGIFWCAPHSCGAAQWFGEGSLHRHQSRRRRYDKGACGLESLVGL